MASAHSTHAEIEHRLWQEVDDVRVGMLGLAGDRRGRMQPMTAFCDKGRGGSIWFYTRKDNALLERMETAADERGVFTLTTANHDFIACIAGPLVEDPDPERIRKYWNPGVAAWFTGGQEDPMLTLLRLEAEEAEVWVGRGGPVRFAWEIAKANATGSLPEVGERAHLDL